VSSSALFLCVGYSISRQQLADSVSAIGSDQALSPSVDWAKKLSCHLRACLDINVPVRRILDLSSRHTGTAPLCTYYMSRQCVPSALRLYKPVLLRCSVRALLSLSFPLFT